MRKLLWLILLAVPVVIVATLPARVVVPRLDVGEEVRDVQGTLWRGEAVWQQPGFVPLDVGWQWDGGRDWSWQARGEGVELDGHWRLNTGATELVDVTGRIEMHRLDARMWLVNARPRGHVEFEVERALIADGQTPEIDGQLVWRDARLEGTVQESLGEITVRLDSGQQGQQARVESTQPGAIQVRGGIELGAERYEVDLWLRASADRPELLRQIAWLGEPQPDGQVRVRLSGALGW
ncbi:type II secretion system protein N [Wenzhouxiangella sp. EGI_FJ10305]|uniref:type II secretion system protein N n=1 Tax=Wenzhouxiangella sp. EGI_FJ10305 TaxID=3243768 RepID=UPI0035D6AF0E